MQLCAGRATLRASKHVSFKEELAVEEAFASFSAVTCALHIIISVLLLCNEFLIVAMLCRDGPNKCLMAATCDFVLLHNNAAEGVAKHDSVGYDIFSGITDTTVLFLEYCK